MYDSLGGLDAIDVTNIQRLYQVGQPNPKLGEMTEADQFEAIWEADIPFSDIKPTIAFELSLVNDFNTIEGQITAAIAGKVHLATIKSFKRDLDELYDAIEKCHITHPNIDSYRQRIEKAQADIEEYEIFR